MKPAINRPSRRWVSIFNSALVVLIVATIMFEVRLLTRAQDAPAGDDAAAASDSGDTAESDIADTGSKCAVRLQAYLEGAREDLGTFFNEHFQSNKPTSELIPAAIEYMRDYRAKAREEMNSFMPSGKTLGASALPERAGCEKILNDDFALVEETAREHMLNNAMAKKTTRLLEKYREINEGLSKLNFTIAQMYGYFGGLSQKLPCYATKCSKG